jgi:hypothetical protein
MSRLRQVRAYVLPAALILVMVVSVLGISLIQPTNSQVKADPGVYVGVAFGGNSTEQAFTLIDRVKDYTNLFILASGRNPISENQTKVEQICDYAIANDLSIIVNLGVKEADHPGNWNWFWDRANLDSLKADWTQRWGDKFLGIYYNDEPGGVQLDAKWRQFYTWAQEHLSGIDFPAAQSLNDIYQKLLAYVENGTKPDPDTYELEADFFIRYVIAQDPGMANLTAAGLQTFTSDYGLYWWDYLGGYNVMFAELGWNSSTVEQIAQVKGAARMQGKEWGSMITWKYNQPPYLAGANEIYSQMLISYQAGAKFIAVFDYPYNQTKYGVLTNQQLGAIQHFWNDITHKQFEDLSKPTAALVLPKDFGWGMRNPTDTIWGFWLTDNRTQQVGIVTWMCLSYYGVKLDIIYDEPNYPVSSINYQKVYYWNSTTL